MDLHPFQYTLVPESIPKSELVMAFLPVLLTQVLYKDPYRHIFFRSLYSFKNVIYTLVIQKVFIKYVLCEGSWP